jgi:hypothetical protein
MQRGPIRSLGSVSNTDRHCNPRLFGDGFVLVTLAMEKEWNRGCLHQTDQMKLYNVLICHVWLCRNRMRNYAYGLTLGLIAHPDGTHGRHGQRCGPLALNGNGCGLGRGRRGRAPASAGWHWRVLLWAGPPAGAAPGGRQWQQPTEPSLI